MNLRVSAARQAHRKRLEMCWVESLSSLKYFTLLRASSLGVRWSMRITKRASSSSSDGGASLEKMLRTSSVIHSRDSPPASTPGYGQKGLSRPPRH